MKTVRIILATLGLLSIMVMPLKASADVNDFLITSFSADETLSRDDPQGQLRVIERIEVKFNDNNHGILRAIPKSYKKHSLQMHVNKISSDSGAPVKYTTYGSNGNTVLKIGDPNRTVTGDQEYTIDYTLRNVISFYDDHDELYWDVNGDQWQQTFSSVSVQLHLPQGLKQHDQPVCFAGSYGQHGQSCNISSGGQIINSSSTSPLAPGQTLTYVAGFGKGYFQPSKWYEEVGEYAATIAKIVVPIIILGGGSFIYWLRLGRDPKGRGTIVPQYEAPNGLSPLEIGAITDFKVDNKDITAAIIDLAVKGYIKIIETKDKKLLRKDQLKYTLELVNDDTSKLAPREFELLKGIFNGVEKGMAIDLSEQKSRMYKTATALRKKVHEDLTAQGYFRSNPSNSASKITTAIIITIIAIYFCGVLMGGQIILGIAIGLAIAGIFAIFMPARTLKGVSAKEGILGLKMYMDTAEKDRINKLQAPDAAYAPNAGEPTKTVELFERLLPYAIVLGVEKGWARQFENLYTAPPDWYSGNWSTFNAYYLASSLNSGVGQAVNQAFSAPSSSSSSGFGGGGFSGGGGGGGGGGGW